jgi:hypothetical protein
LLELLCEIDPYAPRALVQVHALQARRSPVRHGHPSGPGYSAPIAPI